MILAAFRPDTKAAARRGRHDQPTVQMIFRRSLQHVPSRAASTSPAPPIPAAFEGCRSTPRAWSASPTRSPPATIPAEVRIARGRGGSRRRGRRLLRPGPLGAALRHPPGGRADLALDGRAAHDGPLRRGQPRRQRPARSTFHWALLQGDPAKVRIEPLDDGRSARVTLDWHDPFRISEENDQITSRVDIGVFAHNGVHDSAPAILSWYFPAQRPGPTSPDPTARRAIVAVDYADPAKAEAYADPLLYPRASTGATTTATPPTAPRSAGPGSAPRPKPKPSPPTARACSGRTTLPKRKMAGRRSPCRKAKRKLSPTASPPTARAVL